MANLTNLHLTAHAIERYQRRIENVPEETIRQRLATPAVAKAIECGAASVLLPSGHKLILIGNRIVTVKPKSCHKRRPR